MNTDSDDQIPTWSEITRRGLAVPLPSVMMRAAVGINRTFASIKTEIVYEVEAFTNTQGSQRAAGILKRALNPDAALFAVPKSILNTDLVVEEIVKQAGEIAGFANLGLYRKDKSTIPIHDLHTKNIVEGFQYFWNKKTPLKTIPQL
ncbi:hypothetical protein K450DRAFT_251467 [Umbelopsis ramanniana AG]|uniref:Uncharacterized protein n=1 Tax=Umbelopsis ramanniana AG TaxID=1314678 RepID=A0AAD5E8I1_UMBRA|nr:uncharacterized protein K450DRAFT_251467 [Umbelopsis ramanniana AG]KAI8577570.1 hypothetical protein K450DRAFT_251467 [Umbelopsis ramanniana AG]